MKLHSCMHELPHDISCNHHVHADEATSMCVRVQAHMHAMSFFWFGLRIVGQRALFVCVPVSICTTAGQQGSCQQVVCAGHLIYRHHSHPKLPCWINRSGIADQASPPFYLNLTLEFNMQEITGTE